jgi:hypothetical protein
LALLVHCRTHRLAAILRHGQEAGTPPKSIRWGIYKIAAKAVRLGQVEAPDERAAIEKGAAEFKVPANRLTAIRR